MKRFFYWLRSFFTKPENLAHGIFDPGELFIYWYRIGPSETRAADPMVLYKRMMDVGPELAIDIKLSQSPSKDARKGYEECINKIRNIFDVRPLTSDGQHGLDEISTMRLLDDFLVYTQTVKKNSSRLPILPVGTSLTSEPISNVGQNTTNTSGSGLTANATSTEKPELSPTG